MCNGFAKWLSFLLIFKCRGFFRVKANTSLGVAYGRSGFLCLLLSFGELLSILLASRNNHGLFEFVLFGVIRLLIGKAQLMVANRNDITVLQRMFLNQLAVDVGAIGAVQVLEERVIENVDDQGVVATDSWIVDANVIVRKAPNRVALFRHVVFSQNLVVQTKN